ncbi:MAG TPA: alpha/beta hydrolase [Conexibacter sp.]
MSELRVEGAGVELAAVVEGAGQPLLLVHDLAADHRDWAPLVAALGGATEGGAGAAGAGGAGAAGAGGSGAAEAGGAGAAGAGGASASVRTIAYDRRGYGDSGAPEPYEGTTVQEQAQDAVALLRALEADGGDALAVGAGFGALVVLDLLVRMPGLLAGAVLVEPPVNQFSDAAAAVLSEQRGVLEQALRAGGPTDAVRAFRPDADERLANAYRGFLADFGGLASWPVARRELRAVTVPVAVVTGGATPPHLVKASDALAALLGAGRRAHGGAADPLGPLRELLAR